MLMFTVILGAIRILPQPTPFQEVPVSFLEEELQTHNSCFFTKKVDMFQKEPVRLQQL